MSRLLDGLVSGLPEAARSELVARREAEGDRLNRRVPVPLDAEAETVGARDAEGECAGGIAQDAFVKHSLAVQQHDHRAGEGLLGRDVPDQAMDVLRRRRRGEEKQADEGERAGAEHEIPRIQRGSARTTVPV